MMKVRKLWLVVFTLVILLGLSSCRGLFLEQTPEQPQPTPTSTEQGNPVKTQTAEGDEAEPTSPPAETAIQESTPAADVTPTARVGLQATDPETVNLASGEIQLVEFFAFW